MNHNITLVWFRNDLRIADNPALFEACQKGRVLPLFIWSPEEEGDWPLGGASKWWLHYSLKSLQNDLEELGLKLVIRKGKSIDVLKDLIRETQATSVFWNRRYEPDVIARDAKIKADLREQKIDVKSFNASLLFEPWTIANKQGKPFQVFTPFWKHCSQLEIGVPFEIPKKVQGVDVSSESIKSLGLLPTIHWDEGINKYWVPGEKEALSKLKKFIKNPIEQYGVDRDIPSVDATSQMSPYLHFGEISPRSIWQQVTQSKVKNSEVYLRQLGWREFAYHLLYHFPKTPLRPLRASFENFPWKEDQDQLRLWQKGLTGYPIVDAGMRQLWRIGWMHNRVRMIVGSFLVKDLLISWTEGAKWFWDTLVDADLANNTLGWQWVGGCGADAAPYFRIFNPITQGEKFDPEGEYVKQWVPELSSLPAKWIHAPWKAPQDVLEKAGVVLGENYPLPIVDHAAAREEALSALRSCSH